MKPKLFVHAGLHKTGTSYIQKFCTLNRRKLLNDNVLYPRLNRTNHTAFVAWSRKSLGKGLSEQRNWLESLGSDLDFQNAHKGVLLSSEEFSTDLRSVVRSQHF